MAPMAPIPVTEQQTPPIEGVLAGEAFRVTRKDPPRAWPLDPLPARPTDRDQQGLAVSGRDIDDQVSDLAGRDGLEVLADEVDVPVRAKRCGRLEYRPRPLDERSQRGCRSTCEELVLERRPPAGI